MTRAEYLHLLRTAKALDDMRAYLLVKLFVTTDLPIHSLPSVTAEAVSDGLIPAPAEKGMKPFRIPQGAARRMPDLYKRKRDHFRAGFSQTERRSA